MKTMLSAMVQSGLVKKSVLENVEFQERLPEIRREIRMIRERRAEYVASKVTVEKLAEKVSTDSRILERVRRSIIEKTRKGLI